jgi:type II secretory pathway pseudopilin PulG
MSNKLNNKWFTLVELMVAILVFTIWFLSAYLLLFQAVNSSLYSKNEIIAANIAREQIELVKNIRDSNFLKYNNWDKVDNFLTSWVWTFWSIWYFTIENNFSNLNNPIKINVLPDDFVPTKEKILNNPKVELCIDSSSRYVHCEPWLTRTQFYSFVKVSPLNSKNLSNSSIPVTDWYLVESVVINSQKWYREFRINTIITNWRK